jgi:hypothetical protein
MPRLRYIRGMRIWPLPLALATAATLAACEGSSKLDAVTTAHGDCDALWDLAPAGTEVGLVASPRGLALALDAFRTAAQLVETPDFTTLAPELDVITAALFGAPGAAPADAGIAAEPGFAMFITSAGALAVMPVIDRDKFVASKHGTRGGSGAGSGSASDDQIHGSTCRTIGTHYVCASTPALFAQLGTGSLRGKPALAGGRGDIELYASQVPLFDGTPGDVAVVAELSRGTMALRGVWTGTPGGGLGKQIGVTAPHVDASKASGFAAANTSAFLSGLPPVPLAGGVTIDQLAHSFAGPVSAVIPAGTLDFQVHVPLTDPAPATTMLEHCSELGQLLDLVPVQPKNACRFRLQASTALELDTWVDAAAKELRLAAHRDQPQTGFADVLTPIGRELASGDWTIVFWGRGSMLSSIGVAPAVVPPPPEAATAIHAVALVDELGGGLRVDSKGVAFRGVLRTVWANPPELATRLAAITGAEIAQGTAIAPAAALAAAGRGTPFATDFAAGQGGLIVPAGVLGLATAVLVPALESILVGGEPGGEPSGDDEPPPSP